MAKSAQNTEDNEEGSLHEEKLQCFICPQCDIPFTNIEKLDTHLRTHTGENSFQCVTCGKFYTTQKILSRHLKTHNSEDKFICEQCGETFNCQETLRLHIKSHNEIVDYICDVCGKVYSHRWSLNRHKLSHLEVRPYKCEYCSVSCDTASHLKQHVRVHTKERPYHCPTCGKRFNQNSSLTKHTRLHTGDRPYICPDCGKTYRENGHLKIHMRKHSGTRPYKCPICGKSFFENGNMKQHMTVHSEEKKFSCNTCGKHFRLSRDLSEHQTVHTKDRPFSCDLCGKRFKSHRNVRKHEQSQHSNNEDTIKLIHPENSQDYQNNKKSNQKLHFTSQVHPNQTSEENQISCGNINQEISGVSNNNFVQNKDDNLHNAVLSSSVSGMDDNSVSGTNFTRSFQQSLCVLNQDTPNPFLSQPGIYSQAIISKMSSDHQVQNNTFELSQPSLNHNNHANNGHNFQGGCLTVPNFNHERSEYPNNFAMNYPTDNEYVRNINQIHNQHFPWNREAQCVQILKQSDLLSPNTTLPFGCSINHIRTEVIPQFFHSVPQTQQLGGISTFTKHLMDPGDLITETPYTVPQAESSVDVHQHEHNIKNNGNEFCNSSQISSTSTDINRPRSQPANNMYFQDDNCSTSSPSMEVETDSVNGISYNQTSPEPSHVSVLGPDLQCSGCDKIFTAEAQGEFMEHVKSHDVDKRDDNIVNKPNCETHAQDMLYLHDDADLKHHHIQITITQDSFSCSECQQTFESPQDFVSHMKHHKQQEADNVGLSKMSATVNDISPIRNLSHKTKLLRQINPKTEQLKENVQSHTSEQGHNSFQCSECGRTFAKRPYLLQHMKLHVPDKEKCYGCTKCDKYFSDNRLLKTHLRVHSDEKPHECEQCKRRFKVKGDLVRHMRIHTGEKPFCCSDCGKVFSLNSTLTRHMRLHTGHQPYSCHICGKNFTQKGNMKQHLRTHRNV